MHYLFNELVEHELNQNLAAALYQWDHGRWLNREKEFTYDNMIPIWEITDDVGEWAGDASTSDQHEGS